MPASCSQLGTRISSLLDRELNELEARWLRTHIEGCIQCAGEYRELRSARLSVRAVGHHEPPEDFWTSVSERINAVEMEQGAHRVQPPEALRPASLSLFQTDVFGHLLALTVAISILAGLVSLAKHEHIHLRPVAAARWPVGELIRAGGPSREPAPAGPPAPTARSLRDSAVPQPARVTAAPHQRLQSGT